MSSVPWEDILSSNSIEYATKSFSKTFTDLCDRHVPNKIVTIRPNDSLWMTNEVRRVMRRRNRAHKRAKRRNHPADWTKFRQLRNKVVAIVRSAKEIYIRNLDNKINNSYGDKIWWRLVKNSLKGKGSNRIFPPIEHIGTVYEDLNDIVNLMNNYFSDQATVKLPDHTLPVIQSKTKALVIYSFD